MHGPRMRTVNVDENREQDMNQDLIRALSVITEEEQKILDGSPNIDTQIYTEKKELVVDSEKLLHRGKLIQVRPHTRFVHFPRHRHNYVEVVYMCQGTTTHYIDGNKVVLQPGDTIMGMNLDHGGHLTHGSPVNMSGKSFRLLPEKKTV